MSKIIKVLVHIGPVREESAAVLIQNHCSSSLLVPLVPLSDVRFKSLSEKVSELYLAKMPVSPQGGDVKGYIYSLEEFNSFAPIKDLSTLLPGLKETHQATIKTQTLSQAMQEVGLGEEKLTHLVIEQPEITLDLLQTLDNTGQLESLTNLWVRNSTLQLYCGMTTEPELSEWCEQRGLELAGQYGEDPEFFLRHYKRNPLFGELREAKQNYENTHAKLKDAQQLLVEKDTEIKQLGEKLAALEHANERFSKLENKLESLFGEHNTYVKNVANALGQHVTRTARQQRDDNALANYLQHGQQPVTMNLPSAYAVALLKHYEATQHDVVIVLGSQDTTELLAHTVPKIRRQRLAISNGQTEGQDQEMTLSQSDMPQVVLSFEHKKSAGESLKQRIGNEALKEAVRVVYAPWIESQPSLVYAPWEEVENNGQSALFYSADATLERLNQMLPGDARVLVIVGAALPDAGHNREVTLPLLLQKLPTQRLDIILEGRDQAQEVTLRDNWEKILESRQRTGRWLSIPNAHSLRVED